MVISREENITAENPMVPVQAHGFVCPFTDARCHAARRCSHYPRLDTVPLLSDGLRELLTFN
jgi:hypothetical protein